MKQSFLGLFSGAPISFGFRAPTDFNADLLGAKKTQHHLHLHSGIFTVLRDQIVKLCENQRVGTYCYIFGPMHVYEQNITHPVLGKLVRHIVKGDWLLTDICDEKRLRNLKEISTFLAEQKFKTPCGCYFCS